MINRTQSTNIFGMAADEDWNTTDNLCGFVSKFTREFKFEDKNPGGVCFKIIIRIGVVGLIINPNIGVEGHTNSIILAYKIFPFIPVY